MTTITSARRILLVERDPDLQSMLAMILEEEGYAAEAVSTLETALTRVEEQLYDLILTDLLETTHPQRGNTIHLEGVRRLRQACHPTPVGLLTTWSMDLVAPEHVGVAFALQMPFDLDMILRRIADSFNPLFSSEQQHQEQVLRRFLEAVSQGDEPTLRVLCTPTLTYYPLTRSVFTPARAILGLDAYLEYVHLVHQRLPNSRIEYVVVFAYKGRLIARYLWSWQGPDAQRQIITGSVQCRFRGERIEQIGEAFPTQRLRTLLEPRADQSHKE